jgi:hypothetical protein
MTWMMGEMMGDGDVSSYESIPIEIGKLLDGTFVVLTIALLIK